MESKREEMMDTICAISTPAGVGGIAVIRVSGDRAIEIVDKVWRGRSVTQMGTHTVHLGTVTDADGCDLDQAVVTVYRAPHSFTGEDVVEISVHGSVYIQRAMLKSLIVTGARMAEAGEFTRRAFMSGRLDLAQAEAVADIIASESRAAHRIAMTQMRGGFSERLARLREELVTLTSLLELELDFSEEDVEFASREKLLSIARGVSEEVSRLAHSFDAGSAIKNGIPTAIVGATNAGKSSLLNALVGDDRAIVSDIHGTTRDIVEDVLSIGDYTYRLMDTAGLRNTTDAIESIGIERSMSAAAKAVMILRVIDSASPILPELPDTQATVINVINKADLAASPALPGFLAKLPEGSITVQVSAKTGEGIDALKEKIGQLTHDSEGSDDVLVTNVRHYQALCSAGESISRAIFAMETGLSGDLVAIDIRVTLSHLGEILGEITTDEILGTVFSRFCIGK